ncbi:AGC/RSK protein kinase [Saprolegnia diclina VS20]|uniref:AGC/RSK protein kinase n=1 Tax=Saprolegnia diclina (strain VS20) TaxID=1156394 RepID=T0R2G0_SAPDV|nr:AGC/RSK protein kinase [Saprolegnia diclina VS20]EQC41151.1 AGC/RSK protein kinase [Saprolegnia diclina VS20]|eukprot:XP_008604865.1 AGC/RSK protein kinase [Saprolegnia diclina VS20]
MLGFDSIIVTVHSVALTSRAPVHKSYVRVTCGGKSPRTTHESAPEWNQAFQFIAPSGCLELTVKTKVSSRFKLQPYTTHAVAALPMTVLGKEMDRVAVPLENGRGTITISTEWCYVMERCRHHRLHLCWSKCFGCRRSVCYRCSVKEAKGRQCFNCTSERTRIAAEHSVPPRRSLAKHPNEPKPTKDSELRCADAPKPVTRSATQPTVSATVSEANAARSHLKTSSSPRRGSRVVGLSDFRLLGRLGKGGHGDVLLVEKISGEDAGTRYAMKVQTKHMKMLKYLALERDLFATLAHPHTVPLVYAFQSTTKTFLVLPVYAGGDLHSALHYGVFDEDEARFYLAQLYLAVEHMHERGFLHLDLKPGNVLLDNDGHIALTDFGMAAVYNGTPLQGTCGTLVYMAPEIAGGRPFGPAADWWSFGTVAYALLTGQRLFRERNPKVIVERVLHGAIEIPTDLSATATSFLRQLLDRDVTTRLQGRMVRAHPFFDAIDWDKLVAKELPAPLMISTLPMHAATDPLELASLERCVGEDSSGLPVHVRGFAYGDTL